MTQDVRLLPQPEIYMTVKKDFFDADGAVHDEGTRKFLRGYLQKFSAWIG